MSEQDIEARLDEISARLDHVEGGLKIVAKNAYTPWAEFVNAAPKAIPAEVLELARNGNRLKAMQRYRELTGVGMMTARQVIESVK